MAQKQPEKATERARLFPSTYARITKRVHARRGGRTIAQVVDDMERKATLYEKLEKQYGER